MSKSRIIRIIAAAAGLVLVLAALYVAWWFVLAGQWRAGVERWCAVVAAKGWTVSTGDLAVSGFPGAIRLDLPAPEAHDAAAFGWSGPPSALLVSPFDPLEPRFEAAGTHHFTLAGHAPIDVMTDGVTGHIAVASGRPTALFLEAQHLAAGDPATGGILLDVLDLELRRLTPPAEADRGTAPILSLILGVEGLALPAGIAPVLDHTIAAAHLAARLRGTVPPGAPKDALAAWRDAGGTLEIDSLDLDWPPIAAAGGATLALDKDLQPELAGTFTLRGLPAAIDHAVELKMMKPGAAIAAKIVLGLAAKEGPDGQPENKVAVSVQNRILSVGPIKLLQVPEVAW